MPMPGYRFFTTRVVNQTTIVQAVDPYLQGTTVAELVKLELAQIVKYSPNQHLVIDLANVKMISSSVISSLLTLKRQLASNGVSLRLCCMSESLRYVFKTLNMDGTIFEIFESVDEAIAADSKGHSYFDVCGRVSPPDEESA